MWVNPHVSPTCLAGSIGCLCDSTGGCAPGLTCNKARTPHLCCNGSDCDLPANTSVGSSCSGTVAASCTPGITIPVASGPNDNCGYPATSFNESAFICGVSAQNGYWELTQIQAFFNDEHAMGLGCAKNANPVSAMPANPGTVYYPQTGDPTCVDQNGRPIRPALYITDITADSNCTAGDQQQGGQPYDPVAIFGAWKSYLEDSIPDADSTVYNYWDLGPNADPIPAAVTAQCPCQPPPAGVAIPAPGETGGNVAAYGNCPGTGRTSKGYGLEVRYEAALISGHSYRLQIQAHDGDMTSVADTGEACVIFCAGSQACTPRSCADNPGSFGIQSDGCGGVLDCPGPACTP
jgi:hypothetical protein